MRKARTLKVFHSQWQWVKLQAKLWNLWNAFRDVNRKQPSGLLKIALLMNKNDWKWQCRSQLSSAWESKKLFVVGTKRTTQGDSYGMLSHYMTFFLMLGQGDKQEKHLKFVSENELKKSFLIIQNRKIEERRLAGVVACIISWCILRNADPWRILVKPCSVTRGIFNGCIWVHPAWKYYHFIGISSIFVSQQVHSS